MKIRAEELYYLCSDLCEWFCRNRSGISSIDPSEPYFTELFERIANYHEAALEVRER